MGHHLTSVRVAPSHALNMVPSPHALASLPAVVLLDEQVRKRDTSGSKGANGYPMGQPVTNPLYPFILFLVFGLH
jgi:hypothetical protein